MPHRLLHCAVCFALLVALAGTRSTSEHRTPATRPSNSKPGATAAPTYFRLSVTVAEIGALHRFAHLGLPVYCGGAGRRLVALTFDDGPNPLTTPRVERTLAETGTPATFFIIGENGAAHPELVNRDAEIGMIGDHTWTHPDLLLMPLAAAENEIISTQVELAHLTSDPVNLFRPPYGARSPAIDRIAKSRNLVEVMWTVDSRDWQVDNADRELQIIASELRPGAIILLHDIHEDTVEALPRIIALLKERHLTPVSLPALLADDPPTLRDLHASYQSGSCVQSPVVGASSVPGRGPS